MYLFEVYITSNNKSRLNIKFEVRHSKITWYFMRRENLFQSIQFICYLYIIHATN